MTAGARRRGPPPSRPPPRADRRRRPAARRRRRSRSRPAAARARRGAGRQRDVVRVDRRDPDVLEQRERRSGADPVEPRRRHVEAPRVIGQPQRRPVVRGGTSSPAYQPAVCGTSVVAVLGPEREERGAARAEQPLVGGGGGEVEAREVEREPARGLRGVDERARRRAAPRRPRSRSRSATPPVGALHRAERRRGRAPRRSPRPARRAARARRSRRAAPARGTGTARW